MCYALTREEADHEDKDDFYRQLQAATEKVKFYDIPQVFGDVNGHERDGECNGETRMQNLTAKEKRVPLKNRGGGLWRGK